ncbi:hypothetical protein DFA_04513 [Cavenderia fasciculata]|uniref:Paramecium surface antigen repeat-containing protein n=1 Tax=Cavenderia fasciculata TaxID=261658 RepID=F4PPT2_CACFS|nr:uncharacterized protein DFA_04513 [Cavenderia fasciculata]EGG22395.1 hypothetical protein DFA_04513 [Cavenderia fasciculata]|eukprot:XP_004360246.1 hypothetical protein DFA_04513 [Cavenderia fasciculata]
MRLILAILVIILVSINVASSWSCADSDMTFPPGVTIKCSDSSCATDEQSLTVSFCSSKYYCDQTTFDCIEKSDQGGPCSDDNECLTGYECVDSTCGAYNYAQSGETCSNTNQCIEGLECTSGACTLGTNGCTDNDQCAYGKYCNTTSQDCFDRISDQQPCIIGLDEKPCGSYSKCVPTVLGSNSSICVPYFSLGETKACGDEATDETNACDISKGLDCFSGTCQLLSANGYNQTQFSGNCNDPNLALDPCNENSQCTCIQSDRGVCISQVASSVDEIRTCGAVSMRMTACAVEHKCNEQAGQSVKNCFWQHCGEEFCGSLADCAPIYKELTSELVCVIEGLLPLPCSTLGYSIGAAGSSISLISLSSVLMISFVSLLF